MRRSTRVFGIFAAIAALASAQDVQSPWRYRVELFASTGTGGFNNGNRSWGRGGDYGFGVGVRPFSGVLNALGFEVQTARLTDRKVVDSISTRSLDHRFIAVNALYHFLPNTRFQPYLLGGYGRVTANYDTTCTECVFDVDAVTGALTPRLMEEKIRARKGGITFGAGMKIGIHPRLWLRPEFFFLNTTTGKGWNFARYRFQIGAGVHF